MPTAHFAFSAHPPHYWTFKVNISTIQAVKTSLRDKIQYSARVKFFLQFMR
jgi:hypothetical protein